MATAIIRRALAQGINHFETAQGYGCSEIQFCAALGELVESGEVKREDFILQTKVGPRKTAAEFKEALDKSLTRLNIPDGPLGYVDLLSFHGESCSSRKSSTLILLSLLLEETLDLLPKLSWSNPGLVAVPVLFLRTQASTENTKLTG